MNQILSVLQSRFVALLGSTAMLYLIASAVINTMPATLPAWGGIAQWCWTWLHDAAKLFLNLRNPIPVNTASVTDTRIHSVSVETPALTPNQPGPSGPKEQQQAS